MSATYKGTVICPVCHREVAANAPKGGYVSIGRPVRHNGADGKLCDGYYHDQVEWKKWPRRMGDG